jgi:MFS family permease
MTLMTETPRKRLRDRIPPLLRDGPFLRFWSAQSISYIGDQVTIVALPLAAVLTLNATPAQVGLLSAAGLLPNLLISLHVGAWVDRRGQRRKTMIWMDIGRAVLLASVPIAYFGDFLTLAQLFVVAFLVGSMGVIFNVATQGLFASVVPREHFLQGTSLSRTSFSFSWVAGPGIGGLLVSALSAPFALLVDVVSFIGSGLLLRSVAAEEPEGDPKERGSIREGLAFIRRTPALFAKFVAGTALNLFYSLYFALFVLFGVRELHLSAGLIGLAISAGAVGALVGSVLNNQIVDRIGLGLTFVLGSLIYPAALVLMPFAGGSQWQGFVMFAVAEFVSGAGLMMLDISGSTIQQSLTPDRFRARVQGALQAINYGARPVGAVLGGVLAGVYGLRPVLMLAVVGGVLSAIPLFTSPIPRMREIPEESA